MATIVKDKTRLTPEQQALRDLGIMLPSRGSVKGIGGGGKTKKHRVAKKGGN